MSIENLGRKHITPEQVAKFDAALTTLIDILTPITQNLDDEERQRFGSINEQNKLLVNSVGDYMRVQPALAAPEVDWAEFELDYADREFADTRLHKLATLERMLSDFKIVHDFDNYQDALTDYRFARYKSETSTPGFTEKTGKLKQFFPNTGNAADKPDAG